MINHKVKTDKILRERMFTGSDPDQQLVPPPDGRAQVEEAVLLQTRRMQFPFRQSAATPRSLQRAPRRTAAASGKTDLRDGG